MSKAEGNGVVTEKGKERVGNVKLDIEVSLEPNSSYVSNCEDALSLSSLGATIDLYRDKPPLQ